MEQSQPHACPHFHISQSQDHQKSAADVTGKDKTSHPVNVSHPALFIFTQNKGKNRVPQNQFQVPGQLKFVFSLNFSLTCCVWPFLICSYTHLEPFGHHSPTCLAGFPGRVFHEKCIILSMQRHFQASLVFSKPSKINQTSGLSNIFKIPRL